MTAEGKWSQRLHTYLLLSPASQGLCPSRFSALAGSQTPLAQLEVTDVLLIKTAVHV